MRLASLAEAEFARMILHQTLFAARRSKLRPKQRRADFGAKAAAPHGGMDAPAQFDGAVALHDEEAIANRFAGGALFGGEMENIAAVIALPCHRAQDEGRNLRVIAQAHGGVALVTGLHHESGKGLDVIGLDFAHDEIWRVGERKYGQRLHGQTL